MSTKIKIDPKLWIENFKNRPKEKQTAYLVILIGIILVLISLIWMLI